MALVQLNAYGACDNWLVQHWDNANAIPYNLPQYNNCSFVNGEIDVSMHYTILHENGLHFPFPVKKDKSARKIQQTWRNAQYNPSYNICKQRLIREYNELINEIF